MNNAFLKVLGILKPFANFAEGEFAPSESEEAFKKGLSGVQGQSPCPINPNSPRQQINMASPKEKNRYLSSTASS